MRRNSGGEKFRMNNSFRQRATVLVARAFTRWPNLGLLWSKVAHIKVSADVPWTPMSRSLIDCTVCLITTGGLHLKTDKPFNMDDPQGDPTFRLIPATVTQAELTITHNYYNHADADRDYNIIFPLGRMTELAAAGVLKGVAPTHRFSELRWTERAGQSQSVRFRVRPPGHEWRRRRQPVRADGERFLWRGARHQPILASSEEVMSDHDPYSDLVRPMRSRHRPRVHY